MESRKLDIHRLQMQIPVAVFADLRKLSKKRGVSMAEIIRNAINEYLNKRENRVK